MCTQNVCPCLDYKSRDGKSTKGMLINTLQNDNRYSDINRTFASNDKKKVPLYFTKDNTKGFMNFDRCYGFWA